MAKKKVCRWFKFYNCWSQAPDTPCKICIAAINTAGVNAMLERPTISKLTEEDKFEFIPLPGDTLAEVGL